MMMVAYLEVVFVKIEHHREQRSIGPCCRTGWSTRRRRPQRACRQALYELRPDSLGVPLRCVHRRVVLDGTELILPSIHNRKAQVLSLPGYTIASTVYQIRACPQIDGCMHSASDHDGQRPQRDIACGTALRSYVTHCGWSSSSRLPHRTWHPAPWRLALPAINQAPSAHPCNP